MPPSKHHKRHDRTHDRRNDTGLAAPGKKISKKPSNGHLNGFANPQLSPAHQDPSSPSRSAAHDSTTWSSARACPAAVFRGSSADPCDAQDSSYFPYPEPEPDHAQSLLPDNSESWLSAPRPRTDTMDSKPDIPLFGDLSLSTVIRARSLRDVIATLLLLLQLPPFLLMLVQLTFVLLTLGWSPVTSGLSSLFSVATWFHNRPGESAIGTAVVLDLFFMFGFIWLPLWCKDLSLDLSQAVIAISLGGGSASQGRFSISTAIACISIVGCRHLFRQDLPRKHLISLIASASSTYDYIPDYVSTYIHDLTRHTARSHSFLRVWLEVHIIVQGVFRIVRRSMQGAASVAPKRNDSDALATHNSTVSAASNDPLVDGTRSPSTDGRPPGQPPAGRDNSSSKGGSSSKRRRKQATFVRSQQPFWAAIASTKITVSKEFEQSEAQRDHFEAGDVTLEKVGGGSGKEVDDRGWVRLVNDTDVDFEVKLLGLKSDPSEASDDNVSRMVIVRVNGADWGSTNLTPRPEKEGAKDGVLAGKITGLTPSINYEIEFVRASNNKVIGEAAVFSRPVASVDPGELAPHCASPWTPRLTSHRTATILPATSSSQPQRPLSPTSTLKQSIALVDSRLGDVKSKSKKTRKDHRNHINALQRDALRDGDKLKSSSTTDSRHKSREIQFQHNIRQAEESSQILADEIEKLGDIPADESKAHSSKKQGWKASRHVKSGLHQELDDAKLTGETAITEVKHDNTSVSQKREKLDSKASKSDERKQELDMAIANIKTQHEATKSLKTMNRSVVRDIQRKQVLGMNEDSARAETAASLHRQQTQMMEQQVQAMELNTTFPPPGFSLPMTSTPESTFASMAQPSRLPNYSPLGPQQQYPIGTPPVASRRGSVARTRNRKSSMLSDASGFTDDAMGNGDRDDEWHDANLARHNSDDSGSGALAGQSPYDTVGPVPARLSPIGTKLVNSSLHNKQSPRNGFAGV